MHGKIKLLIEPHPATGNNLNFKPTEYIKKVASIKLGMEIPISEKTITKLSCHIFCLSDDITPAGIPMNKAKSKERKPSNADIGKLCFIMSFTDCDSYLKEGPKSNLATFFIKSIYCFHKG